MANDFSGDSNCQALYNFESGAMSTDSSGNSETLTWVAGPNTDTTNYKQGSASADLESGSNHYAYRADGNLNANFPGKGGTAKTTFSVCCWVRIESYPIDGNPDWATRTICGKTRNVSSERSWYVALNRETDESPWRWIGYIGYNGGASEEPWAYDHQWQTGIWYHVGYTYDGSTKAWKIRVWDDNAGSLVGEGSGTTTNTMSPDTANFEVGKTESGVTLEMDGNLDELVIFDDVLTSAEIDAIRMGQYPSVGGSVKLHHYKMAGGL
jgi:hypothetical protein